jgi:hypothetical protein
VGYGSNSIAYSSDGITWTGTTGTSIFNIDGKGVAYGNGRWVAVGYGFSTVIAYSSDGITWTGTTGTSIFSDWGYGVAYSNGRWVACGTGTNTIAYSSDGITWTGIGTSIFPVYGYAVAVGPSGNLSISGSISIGGAITAGNISLTGNTVSTNITTGSLIVTGGVGISGNISIGGNIFCSKGIAYVGSIQNTSDYRIKANVELLGSDFSVSKLVPVKYYNKLLRKDDVGFIAHEVQEVFPQFVEGEKDGEGYQSVNYTGLIAILVKEIQHLKRENLEIRQELQEIRRAVGLI